MANAQQKVNPVDPGPDEAAEVRREFDELLSGCRLAGRGGQCAR
jgi:hypothetical protein